MDSSKVICKDRILPSRLDIVDLNSPTVQKVVDIFLNLVSSCAGPSGKIHVLRNNCGGHVTFTSTCVRLLSSLSMTRPEMRLILAAVQSHLKQHKDCGLFMSCLCLHIIKLSLVADRLFHSQASLLENYVRIIIDYLQSVDCTISLKADFSNVYVLIAYVRSILKSKRILNLTNSENTRLSEVVVKTFVESIPTQNLSRKSRHSDGVYILGTENSDICESRLEHGLLLDFAEIPVVGGSVDLTLKVRSVTCEGSRGGCGIRVALFTCSMSGDVEEVVDAVFEVTQNQSDSLESCVLDKMLELCDSLDRCNVGLVLCQKVIHPKVKAVLKAKSILFVDRLGLQKIPYLQDLTGAQPIASVLASSDVGAYLGWVDSVSHVVVNHKGYLHVTRTSACVVTCILCASWEDRLAELKCCVQTCLQGLYSLSKEPRLLAGGGCWQAHCSYMLRDQVLKDLPMLAKEMECTDTQVLLSLAVFRSSLHRWVRSLARDTENVLVDLASLHCWRVPRGRETTTAGIETTQCCCGLKLAPVNSLPDFHILPEWEQISAFLASGADTKRSLVTENPHLTNVVLDNFPAAVQALERGVSTANMILSVGLVITDTH
ncbi:unnamed protein product [Candidula unifasciata]|uniref:McKusick-Kaufman/Bardet-Biedl syndromes chaperonin n=1 Tax=Candidula unifasciata TaxID=100452 RepID=A0A8S3ZGX2_9EUPU|nr:unnamed protein product [Candidula unifasciata]